MPSNKLKILELEINTRDYERTNHSDYLLMAIVGMRRKDIAVWNGKYIFTITGAIDKAIDESPGSLAELLQSDFDWNFGNGTIIVECKPDKKEIHYLTVNDVKVCDIKVSGFTINKLQ